MHGSRWPGLHVGETPGTSQEPVQGKEFCAPSAMSATGRMYCSAVGSSCLGPAGAPPPQFSLRTLSLPADACTSLLCPSVCLPLHLSPSFSVFSVDLSSAPESRPLSCQKAERRRGLGTNKKKTPGGSAQRKGQGPGGVQQETSPGAGSRLPRTGKGLGPPAKWGLEISSGH